MWGSFVYGEDNQIAGTWRTRHNVFPAYHHREDLWKTLRWRADFACVPCLSRLWDDTEEEIEIWLGIRDPSQRGQYQWLPWHR